MQLLTSGPFRVGKANSRALGDDSSSRVSRTVRCVRRRVCVLKSEITLHDKVPFTSLSSSHSKNSFHILSSAIRKVLRWKVPVLHMGKRLAPSPAGDDPRPPRWALSSDGEVAGPKSRPQNDGSESGSVPGRDARPNETTTQKGVRSGESG